GIGNDRLYGEYGDDTLTGGEGDDYLYGAQGSDTYHYRLGDGHDTLSEYTGSNTDTDRLILGEGILPDEVQFTRTSGTGNVHLQLTFKDGGTLTIHNQFKNNSNFGVEFIEFADGTVLSGYEILRAAYEDATEEADWLYGGSQDDVINGLDGNDNITGANGADTLDGGAGNDTLDGGAGNDTLTGGEGNDTLYGRGDNDILNG
ncbi:calcium-binding protein, partial [Pseudovibrio denitrificans]|uniref:calcium-binding protein n=1 Tax=Pseudovibrio denitrificans TaxID=258256 RepID=UPI0013E3412B